MGKPTKKAQKIALAVQVEIANEVTARAGCTCDLELADRTVHREIVELLK